MQPNLTHRLRRRRRAAAFLAALVLTAGIAAPSAEAGANRAGKSNAVPRLYEPGETVRPAAGAPVKFRWSAEGIAGDDHRYDDFRLFRGNQAFADAMIHDAEVQPGQGWIEIPSEFLNEPGVYCWTVRRIGSKLKTREAFSVFRVEGASS